MERLNRNELKKLNILMEKDQVQGNRLKKTAPGVFSQNWRKISSLCTSAGYGASRHPRQHSLAELWKPEFQACDIVL